MEYIAHRINTVEELKQIPDDVGVELDLRDAADERIYIQHDPFVPGEDFENYLRSYHHGCMILNVKSERIEYKILDMLRQYKVENYFFLDSSFPMIYALSKEGESGIAIRFSEYEGMDTIRSMSEKVKWIWIDSFQTLSLTKEQYREMKRLGYKLCLVSPELQGRDADIERYIDYLNQNQIFVDAICTKVYNIERWKKGYPA